ncbi:MAG: hypothetical protein ACM3VZ_10285 [Acidobacteriota bacterium]
MAYLDIDCECITSIDPKKLATNKSYLTVAVRLNKDHAEQLLGDVIGELFDKPEDFAKWFKAEYPEAVQVWQDDAVANAGEAYWDQRDRMATS